MSKIDDVRAHIDNLDNKIHDLLMERASLVLKIGEEKRKNNVQVIQPDREIVMIRRLLGRHKGPLPQEAVVRIWRELVGAVSLLQTGLKVAVTVPDTPNSLNYWDMAKDYFSSVLPMQKANNPLAALSMVREKEVTFAVVPWPVDEEPNPWWRYLMEDEASDTAMRIVGRLPLGDRSKAERNPENQALVIARLRFDSSGDDRCFIGFELDQAISRGRLVDKVRALKLTPLSLYSCPATEPQKKIHLLEVDRYIAPDDKILTTLLDALDSREAKTVVLGGYPTPPVYEDEVGKNAEHISGLISS